MDIAVKKIQGCPDKPVIVFLHDSFGCIELWKDFPEKTGRAAGCTVLIYDRTGYGKSSPMADIKRDKKYLEREADMLNDLLEKWQIDSAVLFGHSDGGSIALLTAAKYPEKILGAVTVGAHVFVEEITMAGVKAGIDEYLNGSLKKRLEKYHKEKTDTVFWSWGKTWTSEYFSDWNMESFLPEIICPVLVIQGEKDEYGSLKQVESIAGQVSGISETFIVKGAGHTPYKEQPDVVVERTAEFIEKFIQG